MMQVSNTTRYSKRVWDIAMVSKLKYVSSSASRGEARGS